MTPTGFPKHSSSGRTDWCRSDVFLPDGMKLSMSSDIAKSGRLFSGGQLSIRPHFVCPCLPLTEICIVLV